MAADSKKYISTKDLKAHNKSGDLWICIQGKVYNVSDWAHHHPGGDLPFLNLAGQDVTDAFVAYHPPSAWQHLENLSTGYHLQDYEVSEVSRDYRKLLFEFYKMGLFDEKGHGSFVSLCVILLLFSASVMGVLCSEEKFVHFLCGGLMGVVWIQCGWLGHDSGHYQIMSNRSFNRVAQILLGNCLTGVSFAWWKLEHNSHHIACNSLDYDPDIQNMPVFAVSSKFFDSITSRFDNKKLNFTSLGRFLVSYQHWTFYPVMSMARISLLVQSIALLFSKKRIPNRVHEILSLLVFWIWYPLLVSCLPNWGERVIFVVVCLSVNGVQHVQFCLNHFSSSVYMGSPSGTDWFDKQTSGTLDIECYSWMDWFHGGLQFQIEHHLFPRLPRCQLRKVSPFVKELCKKHNVPYMKASFFKANVMTLETLRSVALQARNLANPIPKNLLWEAVNTHG